MDTLFEDFPSFSMDTILGSSANQNLASNNGYLIDAHHDFMPYPTINPPPPIPTSDYSAPSPGGSSEGEYSSDDGQSSNTMLKFIGEVLMEEESLEDKPCMLQDCLALQAAEKSLYDVLGQEYPYPQNRLPCLNQFPDLTDSNSPSSSFSASSNSSSSVTDPWAFQINPPLNTLSSDPYLGNFSQDDLRKKNHRREEEEGVEDLQGRSNKQSAISVLSEEFDPQLLDNVLLCGGDETGECSNEPPASKPDDKKSNGRRRRGNKNGGAKKGSGGGEVVDLWTMLTQCSQSVAINDQRTANELLTQIRNHSSPHGDGMQRTAYYLANALEARLAGATIPAYSLLVSNKVTSAQMLKSYQLYLKACPFKLMSNIYANRVIMKRAETATRLHIIDFGILYGFQWPCIIQRMAKRPGGPPKLRITGIELPQPGFRPAERVEETGRRLENYCKRFNVPFEYHAVAQKWETIKYEDLKINKDEDEMIIVNCLYRLKNIPDETVSASSPRDTVLSLIRSIKPDLFVHGVVNGTYNAPFFLTRFKEALFHFSTLFDMFEANMPREEEQRMLFEREIFARDAINVIACEGTERVERPETYKQWHIRNSRAGLRPVATDQEIFRFVKEKVRCGYHKDFVIHEDGQWMLQGWKGRLIYAISCWTPA